MPTAPAASRLALSQLAPGALQSEIRAMTTECDRIGGINLAQGVCDTPVPAVVQEAARGDGWVKLVGDWIDRDLVGGGDLRPLWSGAQLADAVAAAHAVGARVTAHTFAGETLDDLLAAGIDCLEHATGADAGQIAQIAAAGIPVTATLLQVDQFDRIADAARRFPRYAARMRAMHARRRDQVRDLYDAGVPVLVGTDAGGTIEHGRIADEAAALVGAGLPAAQVVAAASWRARDWLGVAGLVEGASADLVVYATDPRTDIGALADPLAVVLRGDLVAVRQPRRSGVGRVPPGLAQWAAVHGVRSPSTCVQP